jgi:branched-chain amino acid transport system permease protein
MKTGTVNWLLYGGIPLAGLIAPFAFPDYTFQIAVLWVMILFAQTWDVMGGQMGYNSLGNILFFGAGMYISAVAQISLVYDVAEYTSAFGAISVEFTSGQYFLGLALGTLLAGLPSVPSVSSLRRASISLAWPWARSSRVSAAPFWRCCWVCASSDCVGPILP